jgi:hypothetical protein
MGHLLKRLVLLGGVGVIVYRTLVTLGLVGSNDEAIEFKWDDED